MKNKARFIIFIILYIIGYLYFCIYGGINYGAKVSDSPILFNMVLFSNLPAGAVNLSTNIFAWCLISFFLVLFILWQTKLTGPKLNRYALICEGINIVVTCLSFGIVEWIVGGDGLFTCLIVIVVLLIIIGAALVITYFTQKKNGMLNSYEAYQDIMTEEEFEQWMQKKNKK